MTDPRQLQAGHHNKGCDAAARGRADARTATPRRPSLPPRAAPTLVWLVCGKRGSSLAVSRTTAAARGGERRASGGRLGQLEASRTPSPRHRGRVAARDRLAGRRAAPFGVCHCAGAGLAWPGLTRGLGALCRDAVHVCCCGARLGRRGAGWGEGRAARRGGPVEGGRVGQARVSLGSLGAAGGLWVAAGLRAATPHSTASRGRQGLLMAHVMGPPRRAQPSRQRFVIASTACTRPEAPARKFALRLLPAQPPSPPAPTGWHAQQSYMLGATVHRAQEAPGRNQGRPPPLEMQGLRVWQAGHWLGGMPRLPVHCLAFRLVTVAAVEQTSGCGGCWHPCLLRRGCTLHTSTPSLITPGRPPPARTAGRWRWPGAPRCPPPAAAVPRMDRPPTLQARGTMTMIATCAPGHPARQAVVAPASSAMLTSCRRHAAGMDAVQLRGAHLLL